MAQGSEVSRNMGSSGKMIWPLFRRTGLFTCPGISGRIAEQGRVGEPVLPPLPTFQGCVPAPAPRQPWEPLAPGHSLT